MKVRSRTCIERSSYSYKVFLFNGPKKGMYPSLTLVCTYILDLRASLAPHEIKEKKTLNFL